jgi:hypothetical protein
MLKKTPSHYDGNLLMAAGFEPNDCHVLLVEQDVAGIFHFVLHYSVYIVHGRLLSRIRLSTAGLESLAVFATR